MKQEKSILAAIGTLVILIAVLVFWLGPEKFIDALSKADRGLLGLALVVEALDLLALTGRWHVVLKEVTNVKFKDTFLISVAGTAVSNITPSGRVGGEPLKAYVLKKRWGLEYGASFATIVLERIVDMLAFSIISLVAIIYGIAYYHLPWDVISLLVIAFLFSLSILLGLWYVTLRKRFKSTGLFGWLERHEWVSNKIPILGSYKTSIESSLDEYYSYVAQVASNPRALVNSFFVSIVYWILEISRAYVLFMALGVSAPFPIIALAYIFSTIIGSLPLGVGGVGLTEGTMIFIYSASTINTVISSIETILDRLLSYWLIILIGLPLASYLGIGEKVEEEK